jgi:hypothetical protein
MKFLTGQISDPIEVEHDREVHEQHLKISQSKKHERLVFFLESLTWFRRMQW